MSLTSSSMPLLGMLTWRPMSGYELRREIQASLGNFWSESFGQIYPQLRALSDAGLIELTPESESVGQTKKTFAITDAGRDVLRAWISKDPVSRPPRNELLLKVFFASEGDLQVVRDHCRKAREEAVARVRKYQTIETQIQDAKGHHNKKRFWRMTLQLGITDAQNLISWCDECVAELSAAHVKQGEPNR